MSSCAPARTVFGCFAEVARAIAHEHRLELLEHLGQGERGVDALAAVSKLSVANASQHLQQLRRAGLVATRRAGKRVLYRLADDDIISLLATLRRGAERSVADMERVVTAYFRTRDELEPGSRADLIARLRDGGTALLAVRPADEFVVGHLPGAR